MAAAFVHCLEDCLDDEKSGKSGVTFVKHVIQMSNIAEAAWWTSIRFYRANVVIQV